MRLRKLKPDESRIWTAKSAREFFASIYKTYHIRSDAEKIERLEEELDIRIRYDFDAKTIELCFEEYARLQMRAAEKLTKRVRLPGDYIPLLAGESIASAHDDSERMDVLYKIAVKTDDSSVGTVYNAIARLEHLMARNKRNQHREVCSERG